MTQLHNRDSFTLASLLYRPLEPYAVYRYASTNPAHPTEARIRWDSHISHIRARLHTEILNPTEPRRWSIGKHVSSRNYGHTLNTRGHPFGCFLVGFYATQGYSLSLGSLERRAARVVCSCMGTGLAALTPYNCRPICIAMFDERVFFLHLGRRSTAQSTSLLRLNAEPS